MLALTTLTPNPIHALSPTPAGSALGFKHSTEEEDTLYIRNPSPYLSEVRRLLTDALRCVRAGTQMPAQSPARPHSCPVSLGIMYRAATAIPVEAVAIAAASGPMMTLIAELLSLLTPPTPPTGSTA